MTARKAARDEIRVLAPTAILGYGFPDASFEAGVARRPHVIAVDAGSTDPGPYYLGAGRSFTDRHAVRRDLERILAAAHRLRVPVVVGSAGGAGAEPHLDWLCRITEEIVREQGTAPRVAVIPADVDKATVIEALRNGRIRPVPHGPDLTERDVLASTHLVGQMGTEPIVAALRDGADVVLAGRAYDPAVFAALPLLHGFDPGPALHMSKILECAAIAASPGSGGDCMLGTLRADHFVVEPLSPGRRCTPTSVAAHTLYEKSDPVRLPGPGGYLLLDDCVFEPESDRAVRVSGSRHVEEPYTVKLEGARLRGHRTVSIAGARDPFFLRELDGIVKAVRERTADNFPGVPAGSYELLVRVYGADGCMGPLEPTPAPVGHEVGIVIEAVAADQALADTLCAFARSTMLHLGYQGRVSTAGNLAFPYSPSDFHAGEVYEWSVYHLMEVDDPGALFPVHSSTWPRETADPQGAS
ncbi:acyclic terpene utilization AtuA family protein [Streptantibioticus parmotrematis]|uniref:acyclic terpene utilization AtuA family protein n=1 Tax=Streptantibioticus parmotrematis TaxID=2873249 RepID=UPI0033D1669A